MSLFTLYQLKWPVRIWIFTFHVLRWSKRRNHAECIVSIIVWLRNDYGTQQVMRFQMSKSHLFWNKGWQIIAMPVLVSPLGKNNFHISKNDLQHTHTHTHTHKLCETDYIWSKCLKYLPSGSHRKIFDNLCSKA
jgi:hypothetical protein